VGMVGYEVTVEPRGSSPDPEGAWEDLWSAFQEFIWEFVDDGRIPGPVSRDPALRSYLMPALSLPGQREATGEQPCDAHRLSFWFPDDAGLSWVLAELLYHWFELMVAAEPGVVRRAVERHGLSWTGVVTGAGGVRPVEAVVAAGRFVFRQEAHWLVEQDGSLRHWISQEPPPGAEAVATGPQANRAAGRCDCRACQVLLPRAEHAGRFRALAQGEWSEDLERLSLWIRCFHDPDAELAAELADVLPRLAADPTVEPRVQAALAQARIDLGVWLPPIP